MSSNGTESLVRVLGFIIENSKLDKFKEWLSNNFISEELLEVEKIDENTSRVHPFCIAENFCRYICNTFDINELLVQKVIKPIEGRDYGFRIDRNVDFLYDAYVERDIMLLLFGTNDQNKRVNNITKFRPSCHLGELVIVTKKSHPEGITVVVGYLPEKNRVSITEKFVEGIFSYDKGNTTFC